MQGDLDGAIAAYEHAIQHNSWSIPAMSAIAAILRNRDQYGLSIEYLRTILKIDGANGEVWGQLGTRPSDEQKKKGSILLSDRIANM
jgi:tetratricopeptide (TPR) repeat protein